MSSPPDTNSGGRGGSALKQLWNTQKTVDGFYRIPFLFSPLVRKSFDFCLTLKSTDLNVVYGKFGL